MAAWFGDTKERAPDVAIWGSWRIEGKWTAPVELEREKGFPSWNPVLFHTKDGRLWLYYKVGLVAQVPADASVTNLRKLERWPQDSTDNADALVLNPLLLRVFHPRCRVSEPAGASGRLRPVRVVVPVSAACRGGVGAPTKEKTSWNSRNLLLSFGSA